MQSIGEQQFLVLLLVVQSEFNQSQCFARQFAFIQKQLLHGCVHVFAKRQHLRQRWAGQQTALRARVTRPQSFVIRVEKICKRIVKHLIARQVRQQHDVFKKPTGVRQMPFGRAGVRHGLHALILCAQRRGELQSVLTYSGVAGGQRIHRHSAHLMRQAGFFNSPEAIRAFTSLAPPISTWLTNTMGNVGQPVHIFKALRRRHWLR